MKTIVAFLLALINGAAMAEQVKIVGGIYPPLRFCKKTCQSKLFFNGYRSRNECGISHVCEFAPGMEQAISQPHFCRG